MKLLSLLLGIVLLSSVVVAVPPMPEGLDTGNLQVTATGELHDSIIQDADREDRMERCVNRMLREYPEKAAAAKAACERIYAAYDAKNTAQEELRERFSLSNSQAEKLSMVKEERRERIATLSEEQIKKLTRLEVRSLEKISAMAKERIQKISELDEDLIETFSLIPEGRMEKYAELSLEELETFLKKANVKTTTAENAGKKRSISEEVREESEENFRAAKSDFKKRSNNYLAARGEFEELVELEKEACEEEGDACEEAKEETIEKAKEFLEELAEQQLAYIEQMIERVKSSDAFDGGEAEDLLEGLDESKAKVERSLEFLESAESKAEVKEAATILFSNWERIRLKVQDSREEIVYRETKKFVSRVDALEARMNRMIQRLEESEIDTSEYEEEMNSISSKVAEALEILEEGREKFVEFREAENPEDETELLEEAKELFNEAHLLLKEAHSEFMDLANRIFDELEEDLEEEDEDVEIIIIDDPELPKPPKLEDIEVTA